LKPQAASAEIIGDATDGVCSSLEIGPLQQRVDIPVRRTKMGEGIVSKRKDSMYRSGRSPDWLKMKNSDAPAVKREEEEEWGKKKWR
jgi:hypothetical protein